MSGHLEPEGDVQVLMHFLELCKPGKISFAAGPLAASGRTVPP